ncbi:FAD-dependent oxidoreductase [Rhodobacteraceae bacterium KMM 6894]|nr:FAD-dependent oxidoreductase [Rhodobacteraceae bacterium KMM 6894]
MKTSAATFTDSLWHAQSDEPLPEADTPQDSDLVIVGGGFTGLSAALHFAQSGRSVTVFEAREVGFGASGRNGGQVIPGFKYDPAAVLAKHGVEKGEALVQLGASGPDMVFDLVRTHAIACQPQRNGWIQASHSETGLATIRTRAADWQARGVVASVLDRDEMADMTGLSVYAGGWLDARAGQVQPLAYARGLARAARAAGARIVPHSPVTEVQRDADGWRVKTPNGQTRAGSVLIATGAYGDNTLVPGLARTILPAQSNLIATAPMPDDIARTVLPFGGCLSEIRKLAFYVRKTQDSRLVLGGRGAIGDIHGTGLQKALEKALRRMFPQLATLPIAHAWSGQVGLTMDGWPHLHQPEPGLFTVQGYNGRGLALATATGAMIARHLRGDAPLVLPVTEPQPVAWHAVRGPVMRMGIGYYWMRDAMGFPG